MVSRSGLILVLGLALIGLHVSCDEGPQVDVTPPAGITAIRVVDLGRTYVRLEWTATGDNLRAGTATTYDIRYSTSAIRDSTWDSATQCDGEPAPGKAGTVEAFYISGLLPGTIYHFAIRVADEVQNWSRISDVVKVTTLGGDETSPYTVTDLEAGDPTSTSIRLVWTARGEASQGPAFKYDLRYSTSVIDTLTWRAALQYQNEPAPRGPGVAETLRVEGLLSETTYYFAMKAADRTPDWSPMSNVASAATLPPPDTSRPAAVSDLVAEDADSIQVTLRWTATGDDSLTGTATEYDFRYSITPINALTWPNIHLCESEPLPQSSGSPETYIVSGLSPRTTYYFALRVSDEVGHCSALSNLAEATTTAALSDTVAPGPIQDLEAGLYAGTGVHLRWTAPGNDVNSGIATEYDIRYSRNPIDLSNWDQASEASREPEPAEPGTVQDVTVSSLASNTLYYFAMRTRDNASNWSEISNVESFRTANCDGSWYPVYVMIQGASSPSSDSIRVSWVTYGGGLLATASDYDIRYSTSPIDDWNWSGATRSSCEPIRDPNSSTHWVYYHCYISRLREGTTYYIGLRGGRDCQSELILASATTRGRERPDYPEGEIKFALHLEEHQSRRSCDSGLPSIGSRDEITSRVDHELPYDVDVFVVLFGTAGITGAEYGLIWPASWGSGVTRNCAYSTIGNITDPGDGMSIYWKDCQEFDGFRPVSWTWLTASEPGEIQIGWNPAFESLGVTDCHFSHAPPESIFHAGINTDPPDGPLWTGGASASRNRVRSLLK